MAAIPAPRLGGREFDGETWHVMPAGRPTSQAASSP